jgi:hypothetical protein
MPPAARRSLNAPMLQTYHAHDGRRERRSDDASCSMPPLRTVSDTAVCGRAAPARAPRSDAIGAGIGRPDPGCAGATMGLPVVPGAERRPVPGTTGVRVEGPPAAELASNTPATPFIVYDDLRHWIFCHRCRVRCGIGSGVDSINAAVLESQAPDSVELLRAGSLHRAHMDGPWPPAVDRGPECPGHVPGALHGRPRWRARDGALSSDRRLTPLR